MNAADLASTSRNHSFHVSQNAPWRKNSPSVNAYRSRPPLREPSGRCQALWIGRGSREDIGRRRRGSFTSQQASKPRGSWALRIVANCGHLGSSSLFALGLSQLKETAGACPDTQRAEPRNAGESVSFGFIWTGVDKQWWASPLRIAASHPGTAPVPRARTWEAEFLDTNTGHCHTNTGRHSSPAIPHRAQCPRLSRSAVCQILTWTVLSVKTQGLNLVCFSGLHYCTVYHRINSCQVI